jgi:predicted acyltransferase
VAAGWVLLFLLLTHQVTRAAEQLPGFDFGSGLLDPRALRFPGVLQRIGVCYLAAGLLAVVGGRAVVTFAAVAASLLYLVLMTTLSFNGSVPGSFERDTNLARASTWPSSASTSTRPIRTPKGSSRRSRRSRRR